MGEQCEVINCSAVNLSTCTPYEFEIITGNSSQDYLSESELAQLYDEQGMAVRMNQGAKE